VQAAVVGVSLAFFALNAIVVARSDTPTPDEFVYVPEGLYHLQTGDLTFDSTNPPLLKIAMALPLTLMDVRLDLDPRHRDNRTGWGPWIFGTSFMNLNRERYADAYFAARLVIVALGVMLGVLVFLRARELVSPAAALATVALYATMPPILAHSGLATLDIGVTLLLFAALYTTSRVRSLRRDWPWAAATGALFGFAFAVKGTAALYGPLVPVLVAAGWPRWRREDVIGFVGVGALMAVAAWVAILASYGFQGFPLPAPLVEGLRFQLAAAGGGEFPAFLGGSWSQTGWWYYYLYTMALKTPLASLALFAAGAAAIATRRSRDDLWIALPPLLLIYLLSFHYAKDYGVRYMLPAFPFLLVLAGRGVDFALGRGRAGAVAVAALLVWQLAACAVAAPHHLAYFNELAGGTDRARRLLLDSNLDWGQDLGRLKQYMDARGLSTICLGYFGHVDPKVYGIDYTIAPAAPAPGLCAISANFLAGYPYAITYAGEKIRGVKKGSWTWFDRLTPVARVGSSIYVFDVTADDVARLGGSSAGLH
jgi:4-amino-4-deoxy-L-arabinose transferase-like glycosyltransferase